MSETVTVPSSMMMASIVSEESLARDTHTHIHTHGQTFASSILNFFKGVSDFENKNTVLANPTLTRQEEERMLLASPTFTS